MVEEAAADKEREKRELLAEKERAKQEEAAAKEREKREESRRLVAAVASTPPHCNTVN